MQTNRKKRQTGLKRNLEANLANREISKIVSGQNQFLRVAILSVKKGLLRRNFFHLGVDRPFLDEKFVKTESRKSGCLWLYRALKNCFWLPTRADPSRKDGGSVLGHPVSGSLLFSAGKPQDINFYRAGKTRFLRTGSRFFL